jgi:hypothetical protein
VLSPLLAAVFLLSTGASSAAGGRSFASVPAIDTAKMRSVRATALQLVDKGNFGPADSMLAVVDSAGLLDPYDVVRWIQVKGVLSEYGESGRLCCRLDGDAHLSSLARSRFLELLGEADMAGRREALERYSRCVLSQKSPDTLRLKAWLATVYADFGMYGEEDAVLFELDSKRFPSADAFLVSAQQRFSRRLFPQCITPAAAAFQRAGDQAKKSLAAAILYQCYLHSGTSDSASFWLSRASFSDPRLKAQAAAFLQEAGYLDRADSLIATLGQSVTRDTLVLRQVLLSGEPARAAGLAAKLTRDKDAAALWRVRTAVFSGNGAELAGWIDTVRFGPSGGYGAEVLSYRYKLERLKDAPEAMADFGAVEYCVWRKRPETVATRAFQAYPPAVQELLVCDIVKALADKRLFGDALKCAAQVPLEGAGAEFVYTYAEVLIRQGSVDEGSRILEKLMLSHPQDVFSGKARLLLLGLKKRS